MSNVELTEPLRSSFEDNSVGTLRILVSDAENFRVDYEINPYMSVRVQPDQSAAIVEHRQIVAAHRAAGRRVEYLPSVAHCPDMVFTANAALVSGRQAVLGNLPEPRRPETEHYRHWLTGRGYEVIESPYPFSGQGDALPCGRFLLVGSHHRTDPRMHGFLAECLDYDVIGVRTVDPCWYDIDLAVGVVDPTLLLWCPAAFDTASRRRLYGLGVELIEVAEADARQFALNFVSDGHTVTMTDQAPAVAAVLRDRGLQVVELATTELAKGGGGVRCTALTLDQAHRAVDPTASVS